MKEYHKINSIYKRDEKTGKFLDGQWSCPEFDYLKDNRWVWTEKVDGTNIRVMYDGIGRITYGGKTDNAQMPVTLVNRLDEIFGLLAPVFMEKFGDTPVCLYGEGYGRKIQKAGSLYNSEGVDFVLFDIRIGYWWLRRADVEEIGASLGLRVVPIVYRGTIPEAIDMVKQGFNSAWGDFPAEGVVLRPEVELTARNGERIITKIKTRDF